jgi:hypothetical protein
MGPLTSSGIYSENEHIGFSLIKLMLKISKKSNTNGVTSGTETAYRSGAPEFTPDC